jgi:hypothetical protein
MGAWGISIGGRIDSGLLWLLSLGNTLDLGLAKLVGAIVSVQKPDCWIKAPLFPWLEFFFT